MLTTPILLVEDEENDVFFFKRALQKEGVMNRLLVAKDGQAAIDYLQGEDPSQIARNFHCLVLSCSI